MWSVCVSECVCVLFVCAFIPRFDSTKFDKSETGYFVYYLNYIYLLSSDHFCVEFFFVQSLIMPFCCLLNFFVVRFSINHSSLTEQRKVSEFECESSAPVRLITNISTAYSFRLFTPFPGSFFIVFYLTTTPFIRSRNTWPIHSSGEC